MEASFAGGAGVCGCSGVRRPAGGSKGGGVRLRIDLNSSSSCGGGVSDLCVTTTVQRRSGERRKERYRPHLFPLGPFTKLAICFVSAEELHALVPNVST